MRKIARCLTIQGVAIPFIALAAFSLGVFVPGYSSVSQHLSELGASASPVAPLVNTAVVLLGASICAFAIGVAGSYFGTGVRLSPLLILLFGASMVSNGLAPMGTPMHGLYAVGLALLIAPSVFASETQPLIKNKRYETYSHLTAVAGLFYLWMNLVGLDSGGYRGLTQRAAGMVAYTWLGVSAFCLRNAGRGARQG